MRTLLTLSGGLDSTFLLYKIATETDNFIHSFQLDLSLYSLQGEKVYSQVHKAEKFAAKNIVDWVSKNIRPVTHSVIKVKTVEPGDWMTVISIKVGADLMYDFDEMIMGRTHENTTKTTTSAYYQELWHSLVPNKPLLWPLLEQNLGRPHALNQLPKELKELVVTCNELNFIDKKPVACGKCTKCFVTSEAQRMLDEGIDPDVIYDYQLRKKAAGPYAGNQFTKDSKYYKEPSELYRHSKMT